MLEVRILRSTGELMQNARQWNDLWTASDSTSPLARAELIHLWFEALAPGNRFRAIVVEHNNEWVAALPVLLDRVGPVRVGRLPRHGWSNNGELLLHPDYDGSTLAGLLLGGLRRLPILATWFDGCPLQRPEWQSLLESAHAAGMTTHQEYQFSTGAIRLLDDYGRYQSSLSKNHRKNMRKATHRAQELGPLQLHCVHGDQSDRWREHYQLGLQIEDSNWKGSQGSSMLRTPGMASYFERLTEMLATGGFLELLFLTAGDELLAFELGYTAKGTYVSHKVGFDDRFAAYSPGHLLMDLQLCQFHQDEVHLEIDCLSAVTTSTAKWVNVAEPRSRLLLALDPWLGRLFVSGYSRCIDFWRQLRQTEPYVCPPLGAAGQPEHYKSLPAESLATATPATEVLQFSGTD